MTFSLPEILSILGLTQCVYVLVYMVFRSGSVMASIVPSLYFLCMGGAFFLDAAAARWSSHFKEYAEVQWLFWFACLPVGALLVFQIANIAERLHFKYLFLLLLIPIGFLPGFIMGSPEFLYVCGLIVGALSVLAVWLRRDLLDGLHKDPRCGKERFWLIISLMLLQTAFLALTFAYVSGMVGAGEWSLIRTLLGLAFVYLALTSLLRIYPQTFRGAGDGAQDRGGGAFSAADQEILVRFKKLIEEEKIYHEASIGRAELARELRTAEANLSRIVNLHYGQTIPQLLNERRVEDAQRLLQETDASIQNIYEESGFNSITTFNRVFKELTGDSPTVYRTRGRESISF